MPSAVRRGDNKGNRKGKNVSTNADDDDDETDDDGDDATSPPAAMHPPDDDVCPSPSNACADPELGLSGRSSVSHSSLDETKIGEYISYIEHLDELDRHDPEHVDFQEFPDTSRRIRHTSYNTNTSERDLDGVVVNAADALLLERVNSQEEQLKSIQAQIERINSSLTPETRDLLTVDSVLVSQSMSSSSFIQRESTIESTTTTIYKDHDSQMIRPDQQKNVESVGIQADIATTTPKKYVTVENISLVGHGDDTVLNTTPMSAASDSAIQMEFDLRPNIQRMTSAGNPPFRSTSFSRGDSFESMHFNRQQSSSSGVSVVLEREAELEYIKGRDDWKDIRRGSHIYDAIDSDNYHHHRRYSEVDETLEYIRGREDWKQRQAELDRTLEIIEVDDDTTLSISIRDQIDSDEYHHARRLSECLDLAYTNRNVRFVTHGRNGRSRSPFRALRSDMDRNEFVDRYYLKESQEFDRAVSESRDVAEQRIITSERLGWSTNTARLHSRSVSPAPIHILIEDTSLDGAGIETWEEVEVVEFSYDAASDDHSRTSSGWDLEQSYDVDESSVDVTPDAVEPPELAVWDERRRRAERMTHQNTLAEDTQADDEVAGILGTAKPAEMDQLKESSAERSGGELSGEDEEKSSSGAASLKKSKTTRNLLDAERLSVDLSSNEPAIKAIAAKSDEMKRTKSGAISSFLEQERKNEENAKLTSTSSTNSSNDSAKPTKPVILSSITENPQKGKIKVTPKQTATVNHDNMDDLMQETSMGPWFHK